MNAADLDALIDHSLADRRLPTAEKKVLSEWAALHAFDEADRAVARSRAFAAARAALAGEAVAILDWLEEVVKVFARPAPAPPGAEPAKAFFSPGTECAQELLWQFHTAQKTCDVCVFTITDDRITDAIISAHRRGVAVRVITDDDKAHDLGSDIGRLLDGGIPCKIDRSPAHMHHKFAVFDRCRLLTGSFNWTRSASEMNEENLLVTPDPLLVRAFLGRFEELWKKLLPA